MLEHDALYRTDVADVTQHDHLTHYSDRWPILTRHVGKSHLSLSLSRSCPFGAALWAGLDDDGLNVMLNKLFFRKNIQQHRLRPLKAAFRTFGSPRLILTIFSENNYCQCVFPAITCAMRIGLQIGCFFIKLAKVDFEIGRLFLGWAQT